MKRTGQNLYRADNGNYYGIVRRGGALKKKSLRTKDPELAKRRLRDFEGKCTRLATGGKSLTFSELAAQWLASVKGDQKQSSWDRRKLAVKKLGEFFGKKTVAAVTPRDVSEWAAKRGAEISPRSFNIERGTLNLIFIYAMDGLKMILDNPVESTKLRKLPKRKAAIPSQAEFLAIVHALRTGHRATGQAANFVEFLGYSGLRQAEASNVRWRDFNSDLSLFTVTGGKTGTKNHEERTIPVFPALRRLVERMKMEAPSAAPEDLLFRIGSALLALHRACVRLNLPLYGHHSMRHFFCSNAVEKGVDFLTLSNWLGHKDGGILVGKTYGHMRQEHSQRMASLMDIDPTNENEPAT